MSLVPSLGRPVPGVGQRRIGGALDILGEFDLERGGRRGNNLLLDFDLVGWKWRNRGRNNERFLLNFDRNRRRGRGRGRGGG